MKFWEIFRFELTYQLRRPWPWMIMVVLVVLCFLFMRDGSFGEALYTEFYLNSPFMIAMATVFGGLLWLLTGAFISGESASRDVATGMHPLTYTLPIKKSVYLGGRFMAAFAVHAMLLLFVQFTIILAVYLPGVHPDSIGPFRPEAFITAYVFIALPNAFAASALQFAMALWSGRPIAAYVGSLFLFFTSFFIASLILFRNGLGTLLDPIGVRFIWDELSHLWTTVEKSHRLLELKGPLLQNRLVWISFGMVIVFLTYFLFEFRHRVEKDLRSLLFPFLFFRRKNQTGDEIKAVVPASDKTDFTIPIVRRSFGFQFHLKQILTIAWASFKTIATSWTGLVMLIIIPLMAIPVVIDQMVALGIPLVPTTARVLKELTSPLAADMSRWMVIPGFIIFFVGELVWRERESRLAEITDAMPGSEWAPLLGKLFGVFLMLIAFTFALTTGGILAQLLMDYDQFDLGLYFQVMFGLQLPEYLLFTALAMFVHTVVNQKYVGHLVAIIAYAFIAAIATMLGIEHNLLIYGASPVWSYTDMRGFGPFLQPWLWFKLYWFAWALLLLVGAALFWVRGKEDRFSVRFGLIRKRLTKSTIWTAGFAVVAMLLIGGYIFYNTNIQNNYTNSVEVGEWRAEYERRYGKFENTPQPELTAATINIEIYPDKRAVDITGKYRLINRSGVSIDSIHISTSISGAVTNGIEFSKKSTLTTDDPEHRYQIYTLANSLQPGDSIELSFEVNVAPRGFRNGGISQAIISSGGYFNNEDWFPSIGYQRKRGIFNPAQRAEYGLAPRPLIASLNEAHGGDPASLGGGVMFEATIGTSEDQTAVAPGTLQRSWTENGRHYSHYATSAPIGSEWAFFTARYAATLSNWALTDSTHHNGMPTAQIDSAGNVAITIFHHPQHHAHVAHMMAGVKAALTYYSKHFGEYPYKHLTVIEHPIAPGTGMHADPSMISFGQSYSDWLPENENMLDFPYAVMGHEMGHQWTLPYAMVEGLPFLSEGLAWYYGIMLMNDTRGASQTRRLMSFMRQPYPHQPIRRGEPLLRALDPYLAYKRGPLAMYALAEYVGHDRINGALKALVTKSRLPGATKVTTLDLYRELKVVTPDSLQKLLYEFFEVNTLWQFEMKKISATNVGPEEWKITLDIKARKFVYDSAGVETDVPMNDWVPIGIFASRIPGQDELSNPLYLEKHQIHSGEQQITLRVKGKPVLAGIDPNHLLDWEEKEDDDNIEPVTLEREN